MLARLVSTPLLTTTCDLQQPDVLPHLTLGRPPTVVVVKLCLEFAASSDQQVRAIIKGLADMIGETISQTTFPPKHHRSIMWQTMSFTRGPRRVIRPTVKLSKMRIRRCFFRAGRALAGDGGSRGDILPARQPGRTHRVDGSR